MQTWLPFVVSAALWGLVVVMTLHDWIRYYRASRSGYMRRVEVTAHITADVISLVAGVVLAWFLSGRVGRWVGIAEWAVGETSRYLTFLGLSLVTVYLVGKLYTWLLDKRVRAYLTAPADESGPEEESV